MKASKAGKSAVKCSKMKQKYDTNLLLPTTESKLKRL